MIATFFHWRIREGRRDQFIAAWAAVTDALKADGSLGSALFEGEDGTFRALARWPDRATRDRAFAALSLPAASEAMHEAIAQTLQRVDCDERDNRWTGFS